MQLNVRVPSPFTLHPSSFVVEYLGLSKHSDKAKTKVKAINGLT